MSHLHPSAMLPHQPSPALEAKHGSELEKEGFGGCVAGHSFQINVLGLFFCWILTNLQAFVYFEKSKAVTNMFKMKTDFDRTEP